MRYLYVIFFLFYWVDGFAQDASELFSYGEYIGIKKVMFSNDGKCDVDKVLASSKILNVPDYYYELGDDSSAGYPLGKMKRPALCLISISSDMSFIGAKKISKKTNPDPYAYNHDVYEVFPKGKLVAEIIFMPPMRLRKLCDENGIPAINVSFKKKNGRLVRVIGYDPYLSKCALDVAKKIK